MYCAVAREQTSAATAGTLTAIRNPALVQYRKSDVSLYSMYSTSVASCGDRRHCHYLVSKYLCESLDFEISADVPSFPFPQNHQLQPCVGIRSRPDQTKPNAVCNQRTRRFPSYDGTSCTTTKMYLGSGTITSSCFFVLSRNSLTSSFTHVPISFPHPLRSTDKTIYPRTSESISCTSSPVEVTKPQIIFAKRSTASEPENVAPVRPSEDRVAEVGLVPPAAASAGCSRMFAGVELLESGLGDAALEANIAASAPVLWRTLAVWRSMASAALTPGFEVSLARVSAADEEGDEVVAIVI